MCFGLLTDCLSPNWLGSHSFYPFFYVYTFWFALVAFPLPFYLLEVKPQINLLKERFNDQFPRRTFGLPVGIAIGCYAVLFLFTPSLLMPESLSHPKLAAFRQVVEKFEQAPDRYAGDTERRQYNKELEDLINRFDEIPFDVEKDTDDAKAICQIYEHRLEGKYKGCLYDETDEKVRMIYAKLLRR